MKREQVLSVNGYAYLGSVTRELFESLFCVMPLSCMYLKISSCLPL